MSEKAVCFTGHRTLSGSRDAIEGQVHTLLKQKIQQGYHCFYAGGARGFDALAAETVLKLKEERPDLTLVLVLPFAEPYSHETGWTPEDIAEHQTIRARADTVVLMRDTYRPGCYYQRNRYLVDHASLVIAYQNNSSGGTAYTTKYAKAQGLPVLNLPAEDKKKQKKKH